MKQTFLLCFVLLLIFSACTQRTDEKAGTKGIDPAIAALIDTPAAREATRMADELTQRIDSSMQHGRIDSLQLRRAVDGLCRQVGVYREKADPAAALAFVVGVKQYVASHYEQLRAYAPQIEQLLQQTNDAEQLLVKVAEVRQQAVQALGGDSAADKLVDDVASDVLETGLEHLKRLKGNEESAEP